MATGNIKKAVPKGYFITLSADTGFDSITENGFYTVLTGTNAPNSERQYYNVWVQRYGTDEHYLHQIVIGINSNAVYSRVRKVNYSEWKLLSNS